MKEGTLSTIKSDLKNSLEMSPVHRIKHYLRPQYRVYIYAMLLVSGVIGMYYFHYYNIWAYMNTTSFSKFEYPLEIDLKEVVAMVQNDERPAVKPINDPHYPIVLDCDKKCKTEDGESEEVFVLLVIKSKIDNFENRDMIRKTWGRENLVPFVATKRIFLLGVRSTDYQLQQQVAQEHSANYDIVQGYFDDTYYNNTIKLMMGFQWATTHCRGANFIGFMDDDYYLNTYNLVNLLQRVPVTETQNLMIGFIWEKPMPHRRKNIKWYIDLEEYPYRFYPPYPTAGSFFVPMDTAQKFVIGMKYVKYLRFDDVFMGIIAWKLRTKLVHDKNLYCDKEDLPKEVFQNVIAMHGFRDTMELYKAWEMEEELRRKKNNYK